jgi:nicotinate dehydrogenase subunit B
MSVKPHDPSAARPAGSNFDRDQELVVDGPTRFPVDRREFVRLTATGLLVLLAIDPDSAAGQETARLPMGRQGAPSDPNAYLHIGADGKVTCFVGKIEMGQGVMTSLPQLLAEELDVALTSVVIVMGDTDLCPWDMGTFGSLSVRQFGPIMRQGAADARAILLQMAGERLQAPVDRLAVKAGVVSDTADPKKTVTYGQLTEGKRIERKVEGRIALKPQKSYTVVGRSAPRLDGREKVTGGAKYAGDVVPPGGAGVLQARILRPPAHGAVMGAVDVTAAEKVPGVKVVRDGDMVAVLHAHWDEADKALDLIKAEWTRKDPPVDDATMYEHFLKTAGPARAVGQGGSLTDGEKLVGEVIEGTYHDSYVAHVPMEPHSAVAAVEDGKVTVWAGTQTPFPLKTQVMQALKLPAEKVRVLTPYVGGGFGGKSASRQGVEAARLAVLTGRPVRVVFSREEEFFYDTFRPASIVKIRAGLDPAKKTIGLWDYTVYCAGERGAAHFYNIPNHRTAWTGGWSGDSGNLHPFAVGPWRAPGASSNAFGRESHIDVLAAKAGIDPVEFRLKNLTDTRMVRVLNVAAKAFGWVPRPLPSRRGVGVALGTDAGAYVALIAEVTVDRASGNVRVTRIVCAQDMGIVVNPEGALQQIEGCLTMGLGYTLSEEVHFKGGEVLTTSLGRYEIPRFSWLPKIEAVIVDAPEIPSQGGGEPAIVPLGAAVANAVFDATGARLTRMPLTPARVRAALKG